LHLSIESKKESVLVDLVLNIPDTYPDKGIIIVEAVLGEKSSCSAEEQDCAKEHLSELIDVCKKEAAACEGHQAIFNIFSSADIWIKDAWSGIQAEKFAS
jgi:hypothetical protein